MSDFLPFDDDYKEQVFYAWWKAGKPKDLATFLIPDKDGRKPTTTTIYRWKQDGEWAKRAEVLDAQLSVEIDSQVIEEKKKDYRMLAQVGRDVMQKAKEYLDNNTFDTSAAAVRALGLGAEMVAKYSRAADMVDSVLNKTDMQIKKEIMQLLNRVEDEETVDAESEENDND